MSIVHTLWPRYGDILGDAMIQPGEKRAQMLKISWGIPWLGTTHALFAINGMDNDNVWDNCEYIHRTIDIY